MPLFELVRRVLRGIGTAVVAGSAAAVWSGGISLEFSRVLVLVAVSVVIALALLDPAGFRSARRRALAILILSRTALVLLSAGTVALSGAATWVVVLGTVLSVLALLGEEVVLRAKRRPSVWSSNIPGAPQPLPEETLFAVIVPLSLLTALAALIPNPSGSVSWWLISIIVSITSVAAVTVSGILGRLRARGREPRLYAAVKKYDPELVLFTSRPDDASYQVLMWLPYLQATGKRLLIMATSQVAAQALSEKTDVPVVLRRNVAAFEQMAGPSLGAIFYVNASSGNNMMIRYNQYQHVYLGHGDSDKPPSYNPTHAMYDRIFAAGQGAIDRYAAHGVSIPREKFDIVGRPQVAEISAVDPAKTSPVETVLYAPTWRGHVEETLFHSLPQGEAIIAELLRRNLRVIFRPHPFSYEFAEDAAIISRIHEQLSAHAAASGISHKWGQAAEQDLTIIECINDSDAMISDVSSVVSDYLYSGKPFAMMAISTPVAEFAREYPIARGAYVVGADLEELETALNEMTGSDPLENMRAQVRSYYLGDFPTAGYEEHFIAAAERAVSTGQRRVADTAREKSTDSSETETAARDKHDFRSLLRYRVRLLRSMTGIHRLREREGLGLLALAAWAVSFGISAEAARTVLLLVAIGGTLWFWLRTTRRAVSIRRTVGAQPLLFLFLGLTASLLASTELSFGFLLFFSAVALNAETRALQGTRAVQARNLPGLRVEMDTQPAVSADASFGLWAALLFIAIVGKFDALASLRSVWVSVAGAAFILSAIAFIWAAYSLQLSRKDARELPQMVADYGPEFAVYFASRTGANYQYGMWEPYFQRLEKRYIVIVRERGAMREISKITDAPVIFRPTLRSLDEVVPATLRTVFYVNNGVKNTHMVERPGLVNVWLNHGDSEKPACYNPVHAMYDLIFAAGRAGIERYARHDVQIPSEKFVITGRPQVEQIRRAGTRDSQAAVKTVLYAPTWIGPYQDSNVYSLPVATELVSNLLSRGVQIIFRAHPLNYRFAAAREHIAQVHRLLERDAARSSRLHVWGDRAEKELTIEECFNSSDAMISDISAVVSDYLQSEKPLALMAMNLSVEQIEQQIPAAAASYVILGDLSNLDEQLDRLLIADPLAEERRRMRIYYLGDFESENYGDGFVQAARRVIAQSAVEAPPG